MTPYAKYPYATLQQVGGTLTRISEEIGGSSRGAYDVGGLSADQTRIQDAIGGFRDEWEASVKTLSENIGTFGQLSRDIGTMVAGLDTELAKALAPGGGSGPGTSGGPQGSPRAV